MNKETTDAMKPYYKITFSFNVASGEDLMYMEKFLPMASYVDFGKYLEDPNRFIDVSEARDGYYQNVDKIWKLKPKKEGSKCYINLSNVTDISIEPVEVMETSND